MYLSRKGIRKDALFCYSLADAASLRENSHPAPPYVREETI